MVYLVTYDLNGEKNYTKLYEALRRYEYIRDPGLDSVWFISTKKTLLELRDDIWAHMDRNDKLFVTRLELNQYNGWMHKDLWPWIRSRL
jgi:hypothetical protein